MAAGAAVIGTGFMGRVHLEALRRLGTVDVRAVAGSALDKARQLADAYGVPRATADYRELLDDPAIDAVHVCTPNALHFEMSAAALGAGKHVLCEKPLTTATAEAKRLVALARDRERRNCTCYNLRYYPMVQQMRRMCEAGELGEILVAQGTYSQDWLLDGTHWNWRVDAAQGGPLRAMADIGSHWCDMLEHVSGTRIASLSADLATVHPVRTRARGSSVTFAAAAAGQEMEEIAVTTEDFGAMLFHLDSGGRGAVTVSQVSAGCKNRLRMEIFGTRAGVAWNQERPDELWIGRRREGNRLIVKDPVLMAPDAAAFADLPGGHSEGYDDTFKQVFRRFYQSIADPHAKPDYPQFGDGLRQLRILDAVLASHRGRRWVEIEEGGGPVLQ
jgi:predicted dehydrogenase